MDHRINNIKRVKKPVLFLAIFLGSAASAMAEAPTSSELQNPLAIILLCIIIALLVAIGLLSYTVIGAAQYYVDRLKEERKKSGVTGTIKAIAIIVTLSVSNTLIAAPAATEDLVKTSTSIGGLQASSLYTLIGVIALEILILVMLIIFLKAFIAPRKVVVLNTELEKKEAFSWKEWWNKINRFKPIREEKDIMLDHNYDGIQELDNKLPTWWLYGFYLTIIVGGIYLFRFHVVHSAPSSRQEFEIAMEKAEIEKAAYLKNAANKVDETSVVMLTDETSLDAGKKTFVSNCAPCHGAEGQGGVGPNLTDDYWLHKGNVKDVFKTIKYGVPEKGMKSWKDDFSPAQIAQLASFIRSINGSNPPNPKEPQGELYTESEQTAPDSTVAQQ